MPRGRHRHSPPLHRLLPSSVIAGVSVVCALGPWVFSEVTVVRVPAAIAALTAVAGAVVMRRWDTQAGRQVADLTRARTSDEWRFEERVAELETDLEESRELRTKLEQRLREKRTELARLRNEHASLLRRYATAETERATALEGRRLLEIESAAPSGTLALPAAPSADAEPSEEPSAELSEEPSEGGPVAAERADGGPSQGAPWGSGPSRAVAEEASPSDAAAGDGAAGPESRAVFSAEGAGLYRRAAGALARFAGQASAEPEPAPEAGVEPEAGGQAVTEAAAETSRTPEAAGNPDAPAPEPEPVTSVPAQSASADPVSAEPVSDGTTSSEPVSDATASAGTVSDATASAGTVSEDTDPAVSTAAPLAEAAAAAVRSEAAAAGAEGDARALGAGADTSATAPEEPTAQEPTAQEGTASGQSAAGDAAGTSEAAGDHAPEAAAPARTRGRHGAGHFTVPTAVAVVPASPARRPLVEGGFDFFGTQKEAGPDDSVRNEDLADGVGRSALHKGGDESGFKPGTGVRDAGQVIDLTAHDETEQIDLERLRTAAS
ncbi:hypothetical protein [Streptomyces sp. NPDC005573]|uniref:hypothetical protein n=1 Tax=Streptomyces sp. NPDC005573 TaxID=3156890 RepID=UPI0033BC15FB